MARHSDHEAAQRLGETLTALREQSGSPPFRAIERAIMPIFGDSAPTDESIRRLHIGKADPAGTSPELLLALARYYGVEPEELGPEVAERVANLRLLLAGGDNLAAVRRPFAIAI